MTREEQMGPPGGAGVLMIGIGAVLVFHVFVNGFTRNLLWIVLLGLSFISFGISMIRSDRYWHGHR